MAEDLTMTGTIEFRLRAPTPGAFTDASVGRFPKWSGRGIQVEVIKNPDATASVVITGPHATTYRLSAKIPPCDEHGLFVVVTWTPKEVLLYLNGAPVARADSKTPG